MDDLVSSTDNQRRAAIYCRSAAVDADKRIFVQIPAYRDSELAATLADLYRKAARPECLRVAVLWQRAAEDSLPKSVRRLTNLELIEVPYEKSRGCNWARNLLQGRWRDEPYTLFLDSHHRFAAGWDELLVAMYEGLVAKGVRAPLITSYMPPYDPATHPAGRKNRPYKIYPLRRELDLLIYLTSYPMLNWSRLSEPVPADFASAHFMFARGSFNDEIRWDPQVYFTGDEVAMSLRAYTHGYDLYHPHVVIGWHCYDRISRVTHWADHESWPESQRRSLDRLRRLFTGRLRGRFGLGSARSRRSFDERLLLPLVDGR